MLNPISPVPFQGLGGEYDTYFDQFFIYIYEQTLTANQVLNNEVTAIYEEAAFAWRALVFTNTGLFSTQIQDGQGYYISSDQIFSTNMPNTPGDPWPVHPEVVYPAGGRIFQNVTELSGDTNLIQMAFWGVNRYPLNV